MYKISEFFTTDVYYEENNGSPVLYFYYEEQEEEFVYDYLNSKLIEGDEESFTWELAIDFMEDHKEELDEIFETRTPFPFVDIV